MDPREIDRLLRESAQVAHELEQLTEALHDIRVIARRGEGEYLVRSSAGCDFVQLAPATVYRVHEVRALTSGGWEPVTEVGLPELEAMQMVTRTLRPYTAARQR